LIVALPTGDVVWQREQTTPRVGNLAQILEAAVAESGWFSLRWSPKAEVPNRDAKPLATAVAVKPIQLGGEATLLLVQTIALPADVEIEGVPARTGDPKATAAPGTAAPPAQRLHVAGTVPLNGLRAQAMNIPVVWVVALSLPVIVLFLALPAVKLATLTTRERFSFTDAVLLLVATTAIAGLGASMPLTQTAVDDAGDEMLATFSASLQARLVHDVKKVQALAATVGTAADEIEPHLKNCEVEAMEAKPFPSNRCNFWAALDEHAKKPQDPALASPVGQIELDIVAWLDEWGVQVDKWTTKAQLTGPTPHDRFQHYRDLTLDRLWTLKKDVGAPGTTAFARRFTIEPLRAPTTAELAVIVGFRLDPVTTSQGQRAKGATKTTDTKPPARSAAKFLVLNARPGSLLDAVVPPGFGFAVITQDGRVLFHSQENLSLAENFFEEVGESARVRARAQSGRVSTWTGDYHGRPHRLHIERPVAIDGCPWRVVTFRELTPVYAAAFDHQRGTFRLAVVNLCMLFIFAFVVWLRSRFKRRDVRDLLNVRPIVRPDWMWAQAGLAGLAVLIVVLTYRPPAGRALNVVYLFFLGLPFAALWIASRARKTNVSVAGPGRKTDESTAERARKTGESTAERARQIARSLAESMARVWVELALVVALVAALPAIGFSRIAERVQVSRATERLLEDTQRAIAVRNVRVQARVASPAYPAPPPASTVEASSFDVRDQLTRHGFGDARTVAWYSYLDFLPMRVVDPTTTRGPDPQAGQGLVRFLLDWNPLPSRDLAGEPAMRVDEDRFRLNSPLSGLPALAVRDTSIGLPPFLARATGFSAPPVKGVFGALLLAAAIGGLCWARQRLLAHTHRDAPTLPEMLDCLSPNLTHGVMLIGAPRTGKDGVLKRELKARRTHVGLRFPLLEKEAEPNLVESQLRAIPSVPPGWWWPRFIGHVGPSRLWIDVSNLETHLVDRKRRQLALQLLERLFDRGDRDMPRVVVVTTNVDPVAHFEEVFEEERKGIYEDAVPEVELSRFAVLLTRFHRCYVPFCRDASDPDPWWNYDESRWPEVLDWETRGAALSRARRELRARWSANERVSIDDLSSAVANRAAALYQLLWTSCTRREKLVLVQLAQEGFVTPQSADVVAALMAKGLIVLRPGPAIFNYTFRAFLRGIERSDVVREWERGEGHGLWVVAGRLIGSSVLAGGLFFLLTQGYSVEGLLPVLSGTGLFGVPIVRNLVARLTSKGSAQSA
jgi:hypothetical protein